MNPDDAYIELRRDHIMTNIDNWGTVDNLRIISKEAAPVFDLRPT